MSDSLVDDVAGVLSDAAADAVDSASRIELLAAAARMNEPLRLAIAGKVKAGKSTLLNALVGEELAPTDAGECTRIVTWYRWGEQPRVVVHPIGGTPESRPYRRDSGALDVDLGAWSADQVDHMEVWWPSRRLRDLTLIDTPGLGSLTVDLSATTSRMLAAESGEPTVADAVVYLLRHAHSSDLRFLEAFHGDEIAKGTPMNAIGVLSRADEIGSARGNALNVARRVGRRYRADTRLRRLCPVIVPVAGLLAQAGTTLRETEFRTLAQIAALPEADATELMLTADRLLAMSGRGLPPPDDRRRLFDRLGLYGVRMGSAMIRTGGVDSSPGLAAELTRRSGVAELNAVLRTQFTARSRVLKARAGVAVLRYVLERGGCRDAGRVEARLEQIEASAHEFTEVRTLESLRAAELEVSPEVSQQLEALLGGSGHDPATRLGLPADSDDEAVRAGAMEALAFWQRRGEHPMTPRAERNAARVATRSLEGILVGLAV